MFPLLQCTILASLSTLLSTLVHSTSRVELSKSPRFSKICWRTNTDLLLHRIPVLVGQPATKVGYDVHYLQNKQTGIASLSAVSAAEHKQPS